MTCEAVRRRGTQLVDGTNNVQNSKRAPPPLHVCVGCRSPRRSQCVRQCMTAVRSTDTVPAIIADTGHDCTSQEVLHPPIGDGAISG